MAPRSKSLEYVWAHFFGKKELQLKIYSEEGILFTMLIRLHSKSILPREGLIFGERTSAVCVPMEGINFCFT